MKSKELKRRERKGEERVGNEEKGEERVEKNLEAPVGAKGKINEGN